MWLYFGKGQKAQDVLLSLVLHNNPLLGAHCHNVLPVKFVYEDDFLNEIEKRTPKKRILGIGFLRN